MSLHDPKEKSQGEWARSAHLGVVTDAMESGGKVGAETAPERRPSFQGDSKTQTQCEYCLGIPPPAVKACLQCEVSMCTLHLQLHERKEPFQKHTLVGVEPALSPPQDQAVETGETRPLVGGPRSRLGCLLTELTDKLQLVEALLEREDAARAANAALREKAEGLLERMAEMLSGYRVEVMKLIDSQLSLCEDSLRTSWVTQLQGQLRDVCQQAAAALGDRNEAMISQQFQSIGPQAARLVAEPLEEVQERVANLTDTLVAFETMNADLRFGLAAAQLDLRASLNPSEVTLDPDTIHPNLLLSEDLRTVTYSAARQPYPSCGSRFCSFLQVLGRQGFSMGQHSWQVEMEGCQWVVGVCYQSLPRTGLASALEGSSGSWCLMWCDNLLRAYGQGRETQLMKTTMLRRLKVCLNYEGGSLSFYTASPANVHLHTFKTTFSDPVHLAFRMMSHQPKSRMTLCS